MKPVRHHSVTFAGAAGNRLVGDEVGEGERIVLLMHGGGQTRHAWDRTAIRLAQSGLTAVSIDLRGHGESEWIADGSYAFEDFAADVTAVADELAARSGRRPIAVGASLGGIASMYAEGHAQEIGRSGVFSAIVLVDVTPSIDPKGVEKVQGFMRAHAREGFATVEEAADAVAAYLPHRPRPKSTEGLKKNLRLDPDGRWRWHWDPRFLDGPRPVGTTTPRRATVLADAVRRIDVPMLLVRGASSELVAEEHAREFLSLAKHGEFVDVAGARHMVAGDRNDAFADAVLTFVDKMK